MQSRALIRSAYVSCQKVGDQTVTLYIWKSRQTQLVILKRKNKSFLGEHNATKHNTAGLVFHCLSTNINIFFNVNVYRAVCHTQSLDEPNWGGGREKKNRVNNVSLFSPGEAMNIATADYSQHQDVKKKKKKTLVVWTSIVSPHRCGPCVMDIIKQTIWTTKILFPKPDLPNTFAFSS